ncbi:hypothetical protein OCK01_01515 [Rhizobium sp. TRM95796]|nr:hypothetical protein [Rhizobium sp. TRM95796]
MMRNTLTAALMAATMIAPWSARAEEAHVAPVTDYVKANVAPWIKDPVIVNAVNAQNAKNAGLAQADVDGLDKEWRAEVDGGDRKMIDEVLNNAVSKFLHEKQEASEGVISEIFVMDAKGLNVGQSDVTSDYWQGDEAKFEKSFGAGADGFFVDEAEKDESTQALQSQASMTIVDETGAPIGAVTIGINLDAL